MDFSTYQNFYENEFHKKSVLSADSTNLESDSFYWELKKFIADFNLKNKKVLEIGSGNGKFQDIVNDYTGIDIVAHLKEIYHKPFLTIKDGERYPFDDLSFDAIFTRAVFEHIPDIDNALNEMLRVLKNGGVVLFAPAWQVRPWYGGGYNVKKYSELNWKGKIIKFSIIWRNNLLFRLGYVAPKRLFYMFKFFFNKKSMNQLVYKKLKANYNEFFDSDSDACNHIDPFMAILWFMAHGCKIINYPTIGKALCVRTGLLIIKKL